MPTPTVFTDTELLACHLYQQLGGQLRVAAPLGLGKPHGLLNALYRQARQDERLSLTVFTALSLTRPALDGGLQGRFLGPFLQRHFGADYEDPLYALDLAAGRLPRNVRVHEFYMQSGALLGSAQAQRDYISQNYTHVARDLAGQRINLLLQLVAGGGTAERPRYSLSSNPDLTLDFLHAQQAAGQPRPLCVGVLHPALPYLSGHAEVAGDFFDLTLRPPVSPRLFAPPRQPVGPAEYALGLHASALVRDGGCLQIGIGALSDALVHGLLLRQQQNAAWRETLAALRRGGPPAGALDQQAPLRQGLYGASEMVMDGFMHLARAGILRRRSWDDLALEQAAAAGELPADTPGGHYLRGAFFLGSQALYDWLQATEAADPEAIDMGPVSRVNQLYGEHQALSSLQRRDARFFNTCMMATVLGEAVSDGLEDGRVVSGVGGQYNFVAMAHELPGGRSVLLLRAARQQGGRWVSNIRFNYGYCTIPRHLRDVFVTEYGVADLRGKSDQQCIEAMLAICDARFIDDLVAQARSHGKLPVDFQVPARWRENTPQHLEQALAGLAGHGWLEAFPFGSDFDAQEHRLLPALAWLKARQQGGWRMRVMLLLGALSAGSARPQESALLERMALERPRGLRQRLWRRLLLTGLRHSRPWQAGQRLGTDSSGQRQA